MTHVLLRNWLAEQNPQARGSYKGSSVLWGTQGNCPWSIKPKLPFLDDISRSLVKWCLLGAQQLHLLRVDFNVPTTLAEKIWMEFWVFPWPSAPLFVPAVHTFGLLLDVLGELVSSEMSFPLGSQQFFKGSGEISVICGLSQRTLRFYFFLTPFFFSMERVSHEMLKRLERTSGLQLKASTTSKVSTLGPVPSPQQGLQDSSLELRLSHETPGEALVFSIVQTPEASS